MALSFAISQADQDQIGFSELDILAETYGHYVNPASVTVEIVLYNAEEMRTLNQESRSIDESTDVLSFPLFEHLSHIKNLPPEAIMPIGSIIICPQKASQYGESLPQLVHHGLLHICGFDHETDRPAWVSEETAILAQLAANGLSLPPIPDEPL